MLMWLLLTAFILYSMALVFYKVNIGQQAFVQRFGAVVRAQISAGLHVKWPWHVEKATLKNIEKVRHFYIPERVAGQQRAAKLQLITGDENLIEISMMLQYKIEDLVKYIFAAEEPDRLYSHIAQATLFRFVSSMTMDQILAKEKKELQEIILLQLQKQKAFSLLGISMLSVNIEQVDPPAETQAAFKDVINAQQEMVNIQYQAMRKTTQIIAKAKGQARNITDLATAKAESRVHNAKAATKRLNEEELKKIKSYFETGKNVSDEVINLNKVKTKSSSKKIVEKVKIKYFANRLIRKS